LVIDFFLNSNYPSLSDRVRERALYATLDRFLYKIDLQSCDEFKTCATCLARQSLAGNPFCGWCVYTERCSSQHACLGLSSVWLSESNLSSQCPKVTDTQPSKYFSPAVMSQAADEVVRFSLNLDLFQTSQVEYFCDVNVNFNHFSARSLSYSTTLNRIQASVDQQTNQLKCNLTLIKEKLQRFIKQV
jgi:hypothetical protein